MAVSLRGGRSPTWQSVSLFLGRGENCSFALPGAEEAKVQFPQPRFSRAEAFKRGPGKALRQGVYGLPRPVADLLQALGDEGAIELVYAV